jgi:hypothetical protein
MSLEQSKLPCSIHSVGLAHTILREMIYPTGIHCPSGHAQSYPRHSSPSSASSTAYSHFSTHLHLCRHSGTRVLSAIQQGLVPLRNPCILLGHIHRHIRRDRGQTQGFVAIGDRPHLRRDGAHPGWSIEGTALKNQHWVSQVRSPHITLDQSVHTSLAWISRASSCVIWLCGLRDTSSNLVSKFIWRIDRLCAVAVFRGSSCRTLPCILAAKSSSLKTYRLVRPELAPCPSTRFRLAKSLTRLRV